MKQFNLFDKENREIYAISEIKNNRADIETYTEMGYMDLVEYKRSEIKRMKELVNIVKETPNHVVIDNSVNGMTDIQSYFRYRNNWVPVIDTDGVHILDKTHDLEIIDLAEINDKIVGQYMNEQGLL